MKNLKDQIIRRKPVTSGQRQYSVVKSAGISKVEPEKKLTRILKKSSGRDNLGHISVRHRGGGSKRKYRIITDLIKHVGEKAKVLTIEYDPNRTARIAKIEFENGKKAYILAPKGLEIGSFVGCGEDIEEETGSRMKLKDINPGTPIFAVELIPGQGPKFARSAGNSVVILAKENGMATIKLPSGEIRMVKENCYASIGSVSNELHSLVKIGKAGRTRHMGRRPQVRGKAMNPVDHPHGGGEGNTSIGLKNPKTPWGKCAMGKRTRKRNKASNRLIVKRRK